jgi:hypothetical protein
MLSSLTTFTSFFNSPAQAAESQESVARTQRSATETPVRSQSNKEIRASYNVQISAAYETEFKDKFASYHAKGQCFGENLAREAFEARSTIKEKHQEQTSTLGRMAISVRNLYKYGAFNVGYEQLAQSGKNPEEIAYSAFSTGGGDLGLESNGFTDTLNVWKAIKDSAPDIYPEDITPEMIATYKAQSKNKNVNVDAILTAGGSNCSAQSNPASRQLSVRV